jgi:hypothetical protein
MCGIRECLALLQWMTNGKATKREGDDEDDIAPRPVKFEKEGGKWDAGGKGEKEKAEDGRGR